MALGPCPRCGSRDSDEVPGRCLCRRPGHACWHYPVCLRCGYTNGQRSANSGCNSWMPFDKYEPLSTDLTFPVRMRIAKYDKAKRAVK